MRYIPAFDILPLYVPLFDGVDYSNPIWCRRTKIGVLMAGVEKDGKESSEERAQHWYRGTHDAGVDLDKAEDHIKYCIPVIILAGL